ncbi:hypothetical protein B7463_g9897, partial [Scytalidium lignicola]
MASSSTITPAPGSQEVLLINEPDETRAALLTCLERVIKVAHPHLWAICLLCDIAMLEIVVRESERCRSNSRAYSFAGMAVEQMCYSWTQRNRGLSLPNTPSKPNVRPEETTTVKLSTPTKQAGKRVAISPVAESPRSEEPPRKKRRLGKAADKGRERDKNTCVVTGRATGVEGAHIFPYYLIDPNPNPNALGYRQHLWEVLKMFWTEN